MKKKILIIGGGFGGVSTALALEKKKLKDVEIILVSDKSHFEYKPALYKVVTGRSPLEVCIPISEIFKSKTIKFVEDTVQGVDVQKKVANGKDSNYQYDYLVLALGSETAYFDIPGLKEHSFGLKTIAEAMRLKMHIHDIFKECNGVKDDQEEKVCLSHLVIVGAGPSGVELAGELAVFTKELARSYKTDESLITIDLIEAAPQILPFMPKRVSRRVVRRLRHLGINIFTNRPMTREDCEKISIRGMTIESETVVWTAGIKPDSLHKKIHTLKFAEDGKVIVDEYLRADSLQNTFVIGDGAATPFSGMAQTAIYEGGLVADNLSNLVLGKSLTKYKPKKTYYSLPVGPGWAATLIGPVALYGRIGWLFRRLADFRFFLSILPFWDAMTVFQRGKQLCKTCGICDRRASNT